MADPSGNGDRIRLRDVYNELRVTSAKLDSFTAIASAWMEQGKKDHTDYETRLRALERWKYAIPAAVIAPIAVLVYGVTR